jgi:flagellar protein FlgJ
MDFKIDPRMLISPGTSKVSERKTRDLESLRESSRQLESLFVMEMLKAMRKTIPEGGLFEKSTSTEIYQEMLDMETAKATVAGPGLGIADAIYRQMAPLIEKKK